MIILERDSAKVLNKQIPIPLKMQQELEKTKELYKQYLDTTVGGKVLKQLTSKTVYNDKSDDRNNGKESSQKTIPVSVAKERLKTQKQYPTNSLEYLLFGGPEMQELLQKGIKRARVKNTVSEVPKVPKLDKGSELKVSKPDSIEINGGSVTITI